MEEAIGTPVCDVWEGLSLRSKDRVVESLVAIEQKLLSVNFTEYDLESDVVCF